MNIELGHGLIGIAECAYDGKAGLRFALLPKSGEIGEEYDGEEIRGLLTIMSVNKEALVSLRSQLDKAIKLFEDSEVDLAVGQTWLVRLPSKQLASIAKITHLNGTGSVTLSISDGHTSVYTDICNVAWVEQRL